MAISACYLGGLQYSRSVLTAVAVTCIVGVGCGGFTPFGAAKSRCHYRALLEASTATVGTEQQPECADGRWILEFAYVR